MIKEKAPCTIKPGCAVIVNEETKKDYEGGNQKIIEKKLSKAVKNRSCQTTFNASTHVLIK